MNTAHPNMQLHRAPRNVWDRPDWRGVTPEERVLPAVMAIAGASLIAYGTTRHTWRGTLLSALGVAMEACVAAGLCNPRTASVRLRALLARDHEDYVDLELEQTFPASDPPAHMANLVRPRVPT